MENQKLSCSDGTLGGEEIDLLDVLKVLLRYKKMIFWFCLSAFILSLGAVLLMSDVYTATALALPQKKRDRYLYTKFLKGTAVADVIIEKFNLKEVYRTSSRSEIYNELKKRVSISAGKKDYIIYIKVQDQNPERAAGMANAFVDELKKFPAKNASGDFALLRRYLDARLEIVKQNMRHTEQELKLFPKKHKPLRIDYQTKGVIEAITKLKGELASREIEMGAVLLGKNEEIPEETVLREWFLRFKNQVKMLHHSLVEGLILEDHAFAIPAEPETRLQYVNLLLDYRIQTALFEIIAMQREVAKIEELKNSQSIQVLNTAFVPDKKSGPKRSLIVLLTTFTFGFIAVLLAFVRNYLEHIYAESDSLTNNL